MFVSYSTMLIIEEDVIYLSEQSDLFLDFLVLPNNAECWYIHYANWVIMEIN